MVDETIQVELRVNGSPVKVRVRPGEHLLETLRERCGLRSLKDGCQPQGQCGACLAIVDGHPRVTCTLPTASAGGSDIVTLEGLPEDERALIARAFAAASAVQCGACIPGIALHAKSLLDRHPSPTDAEIKRALDLHLCRCAGYERIIDAIKLLGAAKQGHPLPEPCDAPGIGTPYARLDAWEATLGRTELTSDIEMPGMLHGALVLSQHARAVVRSIDTSRAAAMPGVVAVATAKDVPGERWYGLLERDWPGFVAAGEEVRCVGDVVVAIAAVDEATAREAAGLVIVNYDVLPPVLSPEEALREGAPRVNPKHENVLSRSAVRHGDADKALAESAHTVSGTWTTQRVEHLYIGLECAVAAPKPDGRLHVFTQGQGIFDDRRQIAAFLDIAEERIFVELRPSGGAFGGKEDLSIQAHAALLATMTGRPVKIALNREESIRMHPKRHPMTLHYTVGCDKDGRLTAVKARIVGDSGAYASVGAKVLERSAGHACGPYRVPNADIESIAVYTNNPPSGAMRGFGANQAAFALEGCIDLLARATGLDRWEIRFRNALDAGDSLPTGQVLEASVGIKKTLLAVKERYEAALRAGRAVGIACGMKNTGLGNGVIERARARLDVEADGSIQLYCCFTEMGQGFFTAMAQIASEVTGLSPGVFRPRTDSTHDLAAGQTTASRGTLLGGRAVIDAAKKLRADLDAEKSLAALAGRSYAGEITIEDTTPVEGAPPGKKPKTHTAYGFATQLCELDEAGRVARFVAAHDVGKAINPALCSGQIEGAIAMGLGYALTEELECPGGAPATISLRDLGALRARDMPEIEVILVEEPEPEGPFGAKGVGEIGLVPTAAAVAGALEAFDGARRYNLPMKNSPAALAMSVGPHHHHAPPSSRRRISKGHPPPPPPNEIETPPRGNGP